MRHLRFLTLLILIFSITNCEKKNEIVNSTTDAQIVAFHPEKLYCYWGWDIKIGSETIKADSIPNLKLGQILSFLSMEKSQSAQKQEFVVKRLIIMK